MDRTMDDFERIDSRTMLISDKKDGISRRVTIDRLKPFIPSENYTLSEFNKLYTDQVQFNYRDLQKAHLQYTKPKAKYKYVYKPEQNINVTNLICNQYFKK